MAMRMVARSSDARSSPVVAASRSSSSVADHPVRLGQSNSSAKAMHATGSATRARPNAAPRPSATPSPIGPARLVQSPSATSTPTTTSATAMASARCPASWRPAASRVRDSAVGSVRDFAARDLVVVRPADRRPVLRLRERLEARVRPLRRVVVAGITRR